MIFYVLLLASSIAADNNPEMIRQWQAQSALVAELSLQGKVSDCLLRSYCLVGAHGDAVGQMAKGIADSYSVFNEVIENVEESDNLVNIQKLKSSYELGTTTRNADLCANVFRCGLDENLELPQGRKNLPKCENVGAVCPGASIGCALCGMFLPGACGTLCPMAGIFCGASGYLCLLGKP